jgi:signal transduction histidine kinase
VEPGPLVGAAPVRLEQAAVNLLDNALRHGRGRGFRSFGPSPRPTAPPPVPGAPAELEIVLPRGAVAADPARAGG